MTNMTESLWENTYRRMTFSFEGREATVILPESGEGGEWLLKTEYFEAFPALERELVRRGLARAHLATRNRVGTREEIEIKLAFADYLEREFGLAHRFVPIGMSCGGLQAVKLAAAAPARVPVLYLDAPVINFWSWPFGAGDCSTTAGERERREVLDAYGITMSEFLSFRDHPLDHLPTLTAHRIPTVLVYGDSDRTVPFPENGKLVLDAYRAAGAPIHVFCKEGGDHHPHGMPDPAPLADLIMHYLK